jgi:hypothetical protein
MGRLDMSEEKHGTSRGDDMSSRDEEIVSAAINSRGPCSRARRWHSSDGRVEIDCLARDFPKRDRSRLGNLWL